MKNKGDNKSVYFLVSSLLVSLFFISSPMVVSADSVIDVLNPSAARTGYVLRNVFADFVPQVVTPTTKIISTPLKYFKTTENSQFNSGATASVSDAISSVWNSFLDLFSKDEAVVEKEVVVKPATSNTTYPQPDYIAPSVPVTNTTVVKEVPADTSFLQSQINSLLSKVNSLVGNSSSAPVINNNYVTYSSSPAVTYVTSGGGIGDSSLTGFSQGITNQITQVRNDLSAAISGIDISNLNDVTVNGGLTLASISPTQTTNLLYNNDGDLYWAGNVIAGGAVGNWSSNGNDVYRTTGNVGLGTSTPGSRLTVDGDLSVTGTAHLGTTTISGYLTVIGNTTITQGGQLTVGDKIIAPGEIGLGTSSPAAKLAIQSTNASQTALLINATTSQSAPLIDVYSSSNQNLLKLSSAGNLNVAGNTVVGGYLQLADGIPSAPSISFGPNAGGVGLIKLGGGVAFVDNGSSRMNIDASGIHMQVPVVSDYADLTVGPTTNNNLNFQTNNLNRMMISGSGDVRIGTTTVPNFNSRLTVYPDSTGDRGIVVQGLPNQFNSLQEWRTNSGTPTYIDAGAALHTRAGAYFEGQSGTFTISDSVLETSRPTMYFLFSNNTNDINFQQDKVVFKGSGNVGIGTANPSVKLDVNGIIKTSSAVVVGDSVYYPTSIIASSWDIFAPTRIADSINDLIAGEFSSFQNGGANFYGSVGIGTTSSSFKLDVNGTSNFISTDSTLPAGVFQTQQDYLGPMAKFTTKSGQFLLLSAKGGTGQTTSFAFDEATFSGNYTNTLMLDRGKVAVGGFVPASGDYLPATLSVNGSGYFVGSVGIGTTTTGAKLHVNATSTSYTDQVGNIALTDSSDGTRRLLFGIDNTTGANGSAFISGVRAGIDWLPILISPNGGNVGIGSTAPGLKLEVKGTGGPPPASGDAQTGSLRVRAVDGNGLDFGTLNSGNYAGWLQVSNFTDHSINYPLLLNPNGGNVGIGTTTPVSALTVVGTGHFTGNVGIGMQSSANALEVNGEISVSNAVGGVSVGNSNTMLSNYGSALGRVNVVNANAGFGTAVGAFNTIGEGASAGIAIGVGNTASAQNASAFGLNITNAIANSTQIGPSDTAKVTILSSGNVGIGTTTPSSQLTTTGTVQFAGITGGTLTSDATGHITASSDERLKDISGDFTRGLEDIMKINPISYHWKQETGYDTANLYSGFSAQNIQGAIPEAILTNSQGFLTLQDRPILAAVVNAVKELNTKLDIVLAWFSNDGKLHIQNEICADEVCITKDQFKNLIRNAGGAAAVPTSVSVDDSGTSTEPEITDNSNIGDDSSEIIVQEPNPVVVESSQSGTDTGESVE